MPAWRQWWLDAIWPTVRRYRWLIAVWAVVALVAVPWALRAQERGLESTSRAALEEAGVVVDDLSFTGRTAVVTATLTATDRRAAEDALAGVRGIRGIDWQVTHVPVVVTTTTTIAPPQGDPATLTVKIANGRIVLRGTLPDAASAADLGASATRMFGAEVTNRLSVGDVYTPAGLTDVPQIITVLPLISDGELVLDGEGFHLAATAPSSRARAELTAAIGALLDPEVDADIDIQVTTAALPSFSVGGDGAGSVVVSGALHRRSAVEALASAVTAVSGAAETIGDLSVDKTLTSTYVVWRAAVLVARMGQVGEWQLDYDGAAVDGVVDIDGLFRKDGEIGTVRLDRLLDELAVLMTGDPGLMLEVELIVGPEDADPALSRMRLAQMQASLVRMGVDPDRVTAATGTGDRETLRFRLVPADR